MKSSEITQALLAAPNGVLYLGAQTQDEMQELKRIERAGRTCYKSEHNITDDSCIAFFKMLCNKNHYAMLRFGEYTVELDIRVWDAFEPILRLYNQLPYWRVQRVSFVSFLVSGNLQCWLFLCKALIEEEEWELLSAVGTIFADWSIVRQVLLPHDFKVTMPDGAVVHYVPCSSDDIVPELRRHTFQVITDRGITHEIVRHTTLSYAQESTRYVNYDGGDPLSWVPTHMSEHKQLFNQTLKSCYWDYIRGLDAGMVPGDARNLLPHCLKTEIVISGYMDYGITEAFNQGFSHFLKMRTHKTAHKGIQQIANEMQKHLIV